MKSTRLFTMLVALLAAVTLQANDNGKGKKAATSLKVDTQKSNVTWNGKKVTGEHTGNVKLQSGTLEVSNNKLTGGQFTVDMTSITDNDLKDAGYNAKLVGHLKSDDFFGVEKHPTSTFKITKAEPIAGAKAGEANYNITGDLTIKGKTEPVTFPAIVKVAGNKAEAKAKVTIDRAKYDVRYGSKSFFDNLGDKAIYDEFTLDLDLVATADNTSNAKASAGK
jgi:polyisoprenoid-binding protein YceI